MITVPPYYLALTLLLVGCDDLSPDDPAFTRDIFTELTCQGGLSAEEAVDRLKSSRQMSELVVEAHDITAGPPGKVVTIDSGDEANVAFQIVVVFNEGANDVIVYGTKAGEPSLDDFDLVDTVVQGANLTHCIGVAE